MADDSDEPLTAALRSLPSGDAPSESEELGMEAAAFNLVENAPPPLMTRAGIALTTSPYADCLADTPEEAPPPLAPPLRDVALTVSGVVSAEPKDAMMAAETAIDPIEDRTAERIRLITSGPAGT